MNITDTAPFVIERIYNASPERVWSAITNAEKMKLWYFDMQGFEAKVGTEFSFLAQDKEKCVDYLHLCKVTAVEPFKKLAYTWRYEGYPGDSLVTFELFDENGNTRLKLTHEGIETFKGDIHPELAKSNFATGWTAIIGKNLPQFLENN